jgi:hypothetical protein
MAIKNPHKLVRVYLSPEEYKKLSELAKEEGFFMSAYLRNLINTFYYLRHMDEKKLLESGKLDFGGYGLEFSKEVMGEFIQNIAERVKDVDWDKFVSDLNIKPTKRVRAKVITKVKQR